MRADEVETVELNRPAEPAPEHGGGFARALAGSLAAGLVLLALVLLVAELLTASSGVGGPGTGTLVGHAVAAVVAVAAAVYADRSRGPAAWLAVGGVVAVTVVVLWVYWLA